MKNETLEYLFSLNFNEPTSEGVILILDVRADIGLICWVTDMTLEVERQFKRLAGGFHYNRDFQYLFDLDGVDHFTVVVLERTVDEGRLPIWVERMKKSIKLFEGVPIFDSIPSYAPFLAAYESLDLFSPSAELA
jgi:hypothetical protein